MIIGMWSINNSYYRQSKRTYCVTYKPFQCGRLKYPSIVDLLPHDSKTSDKPEQYDWRAKKIGRVVRLNLAVPWRGNFISIFSIPSLYINVVILMSIYWHLAGTCFVRMEARKCDPLQYAGTL